MIAKPRPPAKSPPMTRAQLDRFQWRLNPEKYARNAVRTAVGNGSLRKAHVCEQVDATCKGRLEAHHTKGYAVEHWLHVDWLCVSHHRRAHLAMKPKKKSRRPGLNWRPRVYETRALPLSYVGKTISPSDRTATARK